MYKQIIIVRKDLNMSTGKLAAQVSHASMAFLTKQIRENVKKVWNKQSIYGYFDGIFTESPHTRIEPPTLEYQSLLVFSPQLYEEWVDGLFTKCILQAKNKTAILKAVKMADELGMKEGTDYFLIKDNCLTELTPEEYDENGVGRTLTCIGFRPMSSEEIDPIGKKFHLWVDKK